MHAFSLRSFDLSPLPLHFALPCILLYNLITDIMENYVLSCYDGQIPETTHYLKPVTLL